MPEDEAVRIFLEFERVESAIKGQYVHKPERSVLTNGALFLCSLFLALQTPGVELDTLHLFTGGF